MLRRLFLVISLGLIVSGCVTASNTLSPGQVFSFRLEAVTVGFAPGARLWWGDGERAYALSKGLPVHEAEIAAGTEEGRAYVRNAIASKLRDALRRDLDGQLVGSRPVRIEVSVQDLEIASTIQRIVVGGNYRLLADVNLVDAKSGAVLQAFPAQTAIVGAGGGLLGVLVDKALLDEPLDRVVQAYAHQYRNWLLHK
ncbi:hypothetical protein [Microvirga alba]|uniref:DUF3313 domain-containing protein n=1 Tax=Microvirga alba TaxID=2791025 RepID=A0A931FN70_9HYPH|nr:hypothetical protein [Microvirga alba]MBF9233360.1 hypothetical protein [Microvirga alba]